LRFLRDKRSKGLPNGRLVGDRLISFITTGLFPIGDGGFFRLGRLDLFTATGGFFTSYFLISGFFVILIGAIFAISSSSKLSADGSLSDPELPASSPIVILISFLFDESSFSRSTARILLYDMLYYPGGPISFMFYFISILLYTIKASKSRYPAIYNDSVVKC
jgi:hypothetical protein